MSVSYSSSKLDVNKAMCLAAGLLVSDSMLITKVGTQCYIWYDYKFTNRYLVRFNVPQSGNKSQKFMDSLLSEDYDAVFKYLTSTAKPSHTQRLTGSAEVQITDNNYDGTYNVVVNEKNLYAPSNYVNEDKLAEALLSKAFPQFFKYKKYYLSCSKIVNVLLMSAKNVIKHSLRMN